MGLIGVQTYKNKSDITYKSKSDICEDLKPNILVQNLHLVSHGVPMQSLSKSSWIDTLTLI